MDGHRHKVSTARFVLVAELLDQAFAKAQAIPDYLAHEAERAEQALLESITPAAFTRDKRLADLLSLSHRP